MATTVRINQAELNELLYSPGGAVGRYLETVLQRIEAAAKRNCPVDTGRLRSSITHEMLSGGGSLIGRVGSNVEYAAYVELGTSRMAARPYLRPALSSVA